ncbi:hypothetical protein KFL_004790040 [Klebsormidium nitens]|uniref:Uncharacterized protein n=1 Tax=Klebsormidium nitens TaxID=105231 RepID=A0A1Y1IDL4_KLENI|nr:hypothetical protein KFL_004790040 [Klebsormidium nitens]|eukprot:GAQ89010.1 hypothetical protein KFL_004790040 [Klebsormidium nitens]
MAAPSLFLRHVFGLKGSIRDNIHFIEDVTVVYPAGRNVVVYNIEQKTQRFISGSPESDGISAIAVSANRKLIAVAEKPLGARGGTAARSTPDGGHQLDKTATEKSIGFAESSKGGMTSAGSFVDGAKGAVITLYDSTTLKKRKGACPDCCLTLWSYEKGKCVGQVKSSVSSAAQVNQIVFCPSDPSVLGAVGNGFLPLYRIAFCPADPSLLSAVGDGFLRLYRATEAALKQLPTSLGRREPQPYPCHAWLVDLAEKAEKDRCVVASASGEVLLVEGGEVKSVIAHVGSEEGGGFFSVAAHSKGFVCGGEGGTLSMFEKEDKDVYKRVRTVRIESNASAVRSLALSPNEETLVCALENNQIFVLALTSTEMLKTEDMKIDLLSQSFHSEGITGLDVCARKPLAVTCSTDKSVRVWNYLDRTSDIVKFFPEQALSVAIHPAGFQLLVGFADKLRLMNLLMDDIRPFKEINIKACREVCFSHGGHLFAAVHSNTVQIYSTYTCENVGNLRGHNGKVRSIWWSPDDAMVVTAGMDGAVYEWQLRDFKRERENVNKGCGYSCVVGATDSNSIFAVGSDRKLKELDDSQVIKEFDGGGIITQIVLPSFGRLLFAAMDTGAVRAYKYPLTGEYSEIQCCAGAVARLRVSVDDSILMGVGEDGAFFLLDVKDRERAVAIGSGGRREREALPWAEEVLVTKSDLEEKRAKMAELEAQVQALTLQNEYQLRLKDLNLNERLKELTKKYTSEAEEARARHVLLAQEKTEMEAEYEEKLRAFEERAAQQAAAVENQYQQKLMGEVERYQQLAQEKELVNERWEQQNGLLADSHERVIAEVTEEYEAKLGEERLQAEKLAAERDAAAKEYEETKRQMEEDADREIEVLKERYEQKLTQEREVGLRLKGENGILKKKALAFQKDLEDQKEEIRELFEKKKDLYQTIASLEKDIASLKKEIKERDETIGDKEKRIYDLKKKNQELEKFKFVLDYKIKELKKQIDPREQEIQDMKDQVKDMDGELEKYHKQNGALDLVVGELKLKIDGLQKEVAGARQALADARALVQRFHHDLSEVAHHIQDPKALKEAVKLLYQKHVTEAIKPVELDADILLEYGRQREYLERTVEGLKKKLTKDSEMHKVENGRIMMENVSLIKEINELRRECKILKAAARTKRDSKENELETSPSSQSLASGASAAARKSGLLSPSMKNDLLVREVEALRVEVTQLREQLAERQARVEELQRAQAINESVQRRPKSRELLPPMDGFNTVPVPLSSQPAERPPSIPLPPKPPTPKVSEIVSSEQQ